MTKNDLLYIVNTLKKLKYYKHSNKKYKNEYNSFIEAINILLYHYYGADKLNFIWKYINDKSISFENLYSLIEHCNLNNNDIPYSLEELYKLYPNNELLNNFIKFINDK